MLPKISIVIPGYNCSLTIARTLSACLEQDYPPLRREIVFVDDGSRDGTKNIVLGFPVKYIHQPHLGPAKARNRGWQESAGEIICFTDADCLPDKNWLSFLLKDFNAEDIGAVGGSYGINNPGSLLASCIHAEIIRRHKRMPREVKALGSYNLAISKRMLQELNGFDETYLASSAEDNDLCYRLIERGYKLIFEPRALVYHHHPDKLFPYLKHQFRHGFWRMKLYRKHFKMIKGDDYSGFFDYLSPLIAVMILLVLPFSIVIHLSETVTFLLLFYTFIQLFRTAGIIKESKNIKHVYFFIVGLLRDFWRGFGMCFGMVRFFIPSHINR